MAICLGNKKCQRKADCKQRCNAWFDSFNPGLAKSCRSLCKASDGYKPTSSCQFLEEGLPQGAQVAYFGLDCDPSTGQNANQLPGGSDYLAKTGADETIAGVKIEYALAIGAIATIAILLILILR